MAELTVGLAGFGRFARLHARVLAGLPGVRIGAVCDAAPAARERAAAELPGVPVHGSLDAMLDAGGLGALDVVTDETVHGAHALAGLEHGLPVFVEKPLATSVEDALAVRDAARRSGLPVVVGYVSRFDHRYALVHAAIRAGRLGRVVAISARRGFSRTWFAGFGTRVHPVFESMIHDIDLALWYLGAPVETVVAHAHASDPGAPVPDVLAALLRAGDGRLVTLQSHWLVPDGAARNLPAGDLDPLDLLGTIDAQLDVTGTKGTARIALDGGPRIETDAGVDASGGLWPAVHGAVTGPLRDELAHFCDVARRREPSALVPVEDAVAAVGVADAIIRSSAAGTPVTVRC